MRRREFITLLGGATAAWPLAARAQQSEQMRRIGVLPPFNEADQVNRVDIPAFRQGLAKLGWVEGRNLRIDVRFPGTDADRIRALAAELVSLAPDVIVTAGGAGTRELQRQTQTIPIVITGAGDVSANGVVKNIAHPEGNVTGIANLYASIGGKWLELLKQAAPTVERVGLIYNPQLNAAVGSVYIPSIEEAARALSVKVIKLPYQDAVDIVRVMDGFAAEVNGGLIVLPPPPAVSDRAAIHRLAAQHRLPAIWFAKQYAAEGGVLAYGSNELDRWRRACSFVDRILRGAKVSELPLEFPTKFELAVNLKVAKAIDLTIPENFLLRADELIE
jgi:putative ABC transport system substrate-binding protein